MSSYGTRNSRRPNQAGDDQSHWSGNKTEEGAHLGLGECVSGRKGGRREEQRHRKADRGNDADDEQVAETKSWWKARAEEARCAREQQDADRFAQQKTGENVVGARSDLRERDTGVG